MWTIFIVALSTVIICCSADIGSYDYENDNKINEITTINDRDNLTSNVYILPEQIFNDGKPFYVKKDASGTIDFSAKTTPESPPTPTDAVNTQTTINNNTNVMMNDIRKHDISLDNTVHAQNIHDYLNLPVKYQSSKFVYPLVSSSYANLKYQGNNKNFISNHKYDSSTVKSIAYTTKKYKSNYPTKSHTISFTSKTSTESYTSSTTQAPAQLTTTRKYTSIPSRTSTPGRRYTTLSRVSSTTVRNSLPNSEVKYTRGRSTTTTVRPYDVSEMASAIRTTSVAPENQRKNATEESDGMSLSDLFSSWFNNDESDETEAIRPSTTAKTATTATPSATVMTLRPTFSTTNASIAKKNENARPYGNRYNLTMDSATRKPINRTSTLEFSTSTIRPTEPSLITEYGDKTIVNSSSKFRPPVQMNNIRVSPGSNTLSIVTNGQVSANFGNNLHSSNAYNGQFQAPAQNHMNNIVVLPDSNSASVVTTGQLQTTNRFKQKPIAENVHHSISNMIDETTKADITFIQKGQVTSAEAYDNPHANNIVFHGQSSNSNNIVIPSGTKTASFVTTSQMSMDNGGKQIPLQEQQNKNVENEINVYATSMHSTQRPHGFLLPSTTSIPKPIVNTVIAQSVSSDNQTKQNIRFPTENAEKLIATAQTEPTNNTIKFPSTSNQMPQSISQSSQMLPIPTPVSEGLVKFQDTHNDVNDAIDPNNFKQIIHTQSLPAVNNFVVFRQPQPQPPQLVMGMALPQMIRKTPFVFKQPTFVHYPRKNYTLPNILPQFRPTQIQKQSQQIALNPELANHLRGQMNRAQYLYNTQNLRYKTPAQYMYHQRPPTMQIRPSIEQPQNRRHFDLHPGNFNQRIYDRPLLPHPYNQRNVIGANALLVEPQRFEENMKVTVTNGNVDGNKNVNFENGDSKLISIVQQQQQAIVESQKVISPKVEPVTTLQMIQQQKLLQKTGAFVAANGLSGNRNASTSTSLLAVATAATAAGSADANGQTEKPLYVVYPMQKQSIAGLNQMQRGNGGEIATNLADQMHKPATIQQLGFPYALEKNKSRYILNSRPAYQFEKKSEQRQDPIDAVENDEEDSDRPIAIAYSPTEPNPSHLADVYRPTPAHHSTPVFVNAVTDENLNANQQFEAPFIPSINLENTQSTQQNGWVIVTPPSVSAGGSRTESKGNRISASLINSNAASSSISRSDSDETVESAETIESTTRKFNFDSFKPEFQSGFIPIYKSSITSQPSPSPSSSSSSSSAVVASSTTEKIDVNNSKADDDNDDDNNNKSDQSEFSLESLLFDDEDN